MVYINYFRLFFCSCKNQLGNCLPYQPGSGSSENRYQFQLYSQVLISSTRLVKSSTLFVVIPPLKNLYNLLLLQKYRVFHYCQLSSVVLITDVSVYIVVVSRLISWVKEIHNGWNYLLKNCKWHNQFFLYFFYNFQKMTRSWTIF